MDIKLRGEDIPEIMDKASNASDEELRACILASNEKRQKEILEDANREKLPEGKIIKVIKPKEEDEDINLAVECPECKNMESLSLFMPLEIDNKGFQGEVMLCIKCDKEYKISQKSILQALMKAELI